MRRALFAATALVAGMVAWPVLTSAVFASAVHWADRPSLSVPAPAYYYWRDFKQVPTVKRWLPASAAGSGFLCLLPAAFIILARSSRKLREAKPGETPPAPRRAFSAAHGNADWLSVSAMQALFPGPHPAYGGVVVGEAYRVDRDKVAGVRFDPDNRATWGQGGKAPLLIDPCTSDATHGAVFAGSGGYKTTAVAIPTLAHWTGSVVVLDPSCQLGPMTGPMREAMGHKAVMVGPGLDGFNVLDWIDPRDPLAETHVEAMVERIASKSSDDKSGENEHFSQRGKEMLTCLLADMLWDSTLPREQRTLREFRARVCTPERKMKGRLADIQVNSESPMARDLASTLVDVFTETFSGYYSNATGATRWLSIKPYADMVSGGSLRMEDLTGGKLSVFIQVPMDVLRTTPELARVVIGSLLNTVYRAEGKITGRVLFLLDEVNFLGRLKVLEDARDAGRKYGITLLCMWQSLGQLTDAWGKEGKGSWFNSCSWRMFAVVEDEATAEEVSRTAGKYTMLARTEGNSSGRQSGSRSGSSNRGRSDNLSEQARELIRPDEVRTGMRADEAIIFRRGAAPLRCGRPIYFRRADLLARVQADRYRTAAE